MRYYLDWYDTRGEHYKRTYANKDEVISKLMELATRTDVEDISLYRR